VNIDYKKAALAAGAAVVAYLILAYLVPTLLSVHVVAAAGAVACGYIVYTRVALWEVQKLYDEAAAAAGSVVKKP
jgi:hypothetical protein